MHPKKNGDFSLSDSFNDFSLSDSDEVASNSSSDEVISLDSSSDDSSIKSICELVEPVPLKQFSPWLEILRKLSRPVLLIMRTQTTFQSRCLALLPS